MALESSGQQLSLPLRVCSRSESRVSGVGAPPQRRVGQGEGPLAKGRAFRRLCRVSLSPKARLPGAPLWEREAGPVALCSAFVRSGNGGCGWQPASRGKGVHASCEHSQLLLEFSSPVSGWGSGSGGDWPGEGRWRWSFRDVARQCPGLRCQGYTCPPASE